MRILSLMSALMAVAGLLAAPPTVTAQQRYPWNGKVDLVVTFNGASNDVAQATCAFTATNSATQAALAITSVTEVGTGPVAAGVGTWTRHFVWDATADMGEVQIADVAITVEATMPLGGVQLWENGPCWAECNVGASQPEEYGYCFWWGDTVGYKRNASGDGWVSVKDGTSFTFDQSNCPTYRKNVSSLQSLGYIDSTGNLVAAHDAATAHFGAPWRMPTSDEIEALFLNCTTMWTTRNGVYGRLVTGQGDYASKSIFLPAAGWGEGSDLYYAGSYGLYWSSMSALYSYSANYLFWASEEVSLVDCEFWIGMSVRPLRESSQSDMTVTALDTRTVARTTTGTTEQIRFSPAWATAVDGAVVTVFLNGVAVTNATEAGTFEWTPTQNGTYTFTQAVAVDGVQTGETLSATFVVKGPDPAVTAVMAQPRYPWNGKVDLVVTINGLSNDVAQATCTFAAMNSLTQAALAIKSVTEVGTGPVAAGAGAWTRHFVWDATADVGEVQIADVAITAGVVVPLGGVQLWENGPCWSEYNVGASKPEEYGYYFWWGDTVGYKFVGSSWNAVDGSKTGFSFESGNCPTYDKDSSTLQSLGYIDSTGNLVAAHDAATAHFGAPWRMPTYAEIEALVSNCTTTWTTRNGVYGRLVTGQGDYASKSIFLPAAGYGYESDLCYAGICWCYWSSTPDSSVAIYLYGDSKKVELLECPFCVGMSVRPLRESTQSDVTVTAHVALDTRTGARTTTDTTEQIRFSPAWETTADGAVVTVYLNGVAVTNATEAGMFEWTPEQGGTYTLTQEVSVDGKQIGETLSATFVVEAPTVTAQQRYPWNGKVDIVVTVRGTSNNVAQTTCAFTAVSRVTQAALAITSVTEVGTGPVAAGVGTWTRHFVWDATADLGAVQIADVAINVKVVKPPLGGVQLWENGPYWAECNVGASQPEEYGYYFWWGDTVGYQRVESSWNAADGSATGFSFVSGNCPTSNKSSSSLKSLGYIDSTGNLVAAHDAATAYLDAPWRMPTDSEMGALISNCTTTWTTRNGVYGRLVTGKGDYAEKSIFLPAATRVIGSNLNNVGNDGYYWSSTSDSYGALCLYFHSSDLRQYSNNRNGGLSVRPLRDSTQSTTTEFTVTAHVALDTCTGTWTNAGATEQIRFSPAWETAADGAVATVSLNGVAVTNATEAGTFEWTPAQSGTYTFTHAVSVDGVQTGETLSATFVVEGPDPTVTAVTAQPRCPWNGKVDIVVTINGLSNDVAQATCAFTATNSATQSALAMTSVTEVGTGPVSAGAGAWTRHYVWDAAADVGEVQIADVAITVGVAVPLGGVQTAHVALDTRTGTRTNVGATEQIHFSPAWDMAADGAVVTVSLNGVAVTNATEAGMFEWTPTQSGTYTFTQTVAVDGVQTGEALSVTFVVEAPTMTAVTAQPRSPWNGKVDLVVTINGLSNEVAQATCVFTATNSATQTALAMTSVTEVGTGPVSAGAGAWTRHYVWDAAADVGAVQIADVAITARVVVPLGGVQTAHVALDTRTGTRTNVGATEQIHFSPAWDMAADGAVVTVCLNGVAVTNATEAGMFEWTPTQSGTYTFTQTVAVDGVQTGETLSATFVVEDPTVTAVTAQPRSPWNGKVDLVVTINGLSNEVAQATCAFTATNSATQTALAMTSVTEVGTGPVAAGAGAWTRHYVWDAAADVGEVQIADVAINVGVAVPLGGVQLWANGPYWAECNVGASKPEEYGYYFWWGDTVGYKRVGSSWNAADGSTTGFSFASGNCPTYGKNKSTLQSLGYIDSTGNLVAAHDAATAHLGAPWRMPTSDEIDALISNCTTTWTTRNGVYGRLVTGKGEYAAKSIFLPAAGFGHGSNLYQAGSSGFSWFSTPYSGSAWFLFFSSSYFVGNYIERFYGGAVRPLREFALSDETGYSVAAHVALDTRTGTRTNVGATEQIHFSPAWDMAADGAVVTVCLNGVAVTNATEAGMFEWTPTHSGTYTFTQTVAVDGVQTGEALSATFVVEAPTVTAVTAQPRSPWNGKVDLVVTINGLSNEVAQATCAFTATNSATQTALAMTSVTEVGTGPVSAGAGAWTRHYVWDATADVGEVQIADVAITARVVVPHGGVQLWANGPYWAECNVGASEPEEYGYYFWWGDTVGYVREGGTWTDEWSWYTDVTWVSSTGERMDESPFDEYTCPTIGLDTSSLQSHGYIDATGNLVAAYDAATAHLGAPWRMPTSAEIEALLENCTTTWITTNGVSGRLVTGKGDYASKSIFLPATGYGFGSYLCETGSGGRYWSSTPDPDACSFAWGLHFYTSEDIGRYVCEESAAMTVRPLREFVQSGETEFSVMTHVALDTRTGARANAGTTEQIRFSPAWETAAVGAVVTVCLNGVAVTNATEAGIFEWTPTQSGTYTFTQTVAVDGVQTGEALSVTFVVEGPDPTVTAVTAQPRSPWNGKVDLVVTINGLSNDVAQATCAFTATNSATQAALAMTSVTEVGTGPVAAGVGAWTRHYVWDATDDVGEVKIADVAITARVVMPHGGVQLWANGPYWAECNVGASKPEESGYYFWWGDTVGYVREGGTWTDDWYYVDVTWVSSTGERMDESPFDEYTCPTIGLDTSSLQSYGYIDATGNLVAAYDAATAHLGAPWRMPTSTEIEALLENCTTTWITTNGVSGRLVTGKGDYASKSIFLPATGHGFGSELYEVGLGGRYWSSTPDPDGCSFAWELNFITSKDIGQYLCDINVAMTVRPLREFVQSGATEFSVMTHVALDTRTGARTNAGTTEQIRFSPAWETDTDGAVVTVYLNGVAVTNATEAGIFEWTPDQSGTCTFTHVVSLEGVQIGEPLSATFVVEGPDPAVTAVTAQPRYPWNGKVDLVVTINGLSNDVAQATCVFTATNSATQAALAMTSVTEVGAGPVAAGVGTWTRHYVWDATADVDEVQIADVAINVGVAVPLSDGVQLWANGPYWAECNVGASKPEESGYYFWWGDTVGYTRDGGTWTDDCYYSGVTWVSSTGERMSASPFGWNTCPTMDKDTSTLRSLGYIDSTGDLVAAHDAATAHLGAPWRMPTASEMSALIDNCTTTWTSLNGVYGRLVTGKGDYAEKSIFLPAAGEGNESYLSCIGSSSCYWSSTPYSNSYNAWDLGVNSSSLDWNSCYVRSIGRPVRPLRELALYGETEFSVTTHVALDTRTGARTTTGEQISFSPAWETDADGAVATVCLNGVAVTNATEAGAFAWTPVQEGTYTFTHAVSVNGVQTGETLSATFNVLFATQTTDVPVPFDWLKRYYPSVSDYESKAKETAANGHNTVEEAYVAGLDPTSATSELEATVACSNGVVYVGWTPNLNSNGLARVYRILGKCDLSDSNEEWKPVGAGHRFFKVTVAMPGPSATSDEPGPVDLSDHLLAHLSFDDAGNDGLNVLKVEGGEDAIVRTTKANVVAGLGSVSVVSDSTILSGLDSGDGAVFIPKGTHLALPIPAALLDREGHPYTIKMKVKFPGFGKYYSLLNMPAANNSDIMVFLSNASSPIIRLKVTNKGSGQGFSGGGGFTANEWETVTLQFGENATKVFLNGTQIIARDVVLSSSYADCYDAGGYFILSGDDDTDDNDMYWADVRVYDGVVDP